MNFHEPLETIKADPPVIHLRKHFRGTFSNPAQLIYLTTHLPKLAIAGVCSCPWRMRLLLLIIGLGT